MLKRRQETSQTDEETGSPARETAGQFLRQKREDSGYDLRQVADQLRIRYVYLAAIEEDRLDDLPGATYAVGFVRAYAELLNLDGPAIVDRFKEETAELAKEARLVFPSPQSEGKVPSGAILLLSIVAVALVYGGWVFLSSKDRPIAELVPALPDSFLALIGKADPAPSANDAPVLPLPTESAGTAVPAESTVSQPDMPGVTAAPVSPVTVETGVIPPPSIAGPVTEGSQPSETAQAAAQTVLPGPETSDNVASPETSAEPVPNNGPVLAAREQQELTSDSMPDVSREASPATDGNADSNNQPVDDRQEVAAIDTAEATAPATAFVPEPETNAVDAPPAVLSDGSPPVATQPEDTPEQASANIDLTALPAPPAPPRLDTTRQREYGEENADARVVLRAAAEVWVQVRDSGGNLLLTRLLRAGDSYRVPNDPGLVMRTGNAGGLDIIVDGNAIPRIGSKGAVMKEVHLDADLLKSGTATRQ